jgi:hypothetical protein
MADRELYVVEFHNGHEPHDSLADHIRVVIDGVTSGLQQVQAGEGGPKQMLALTEGWCQLHLAVLLALHCETLYKAGFTAEQVRTDLKRWLAKNPGAENWYL